MYKWYNNNVYKLIVFNNRQKYNILYTAVLEWNFSVHFLLKNVFFFWEKIIFRENPPKMLE